MRKLMGLIIASAIIGVSGAEAQTAKQPAKPAPKKSVATPAKPATPALPAPSAPVAKPAVKKDTVIRHRVVKHKKIKPRPKAAATQKEETLEYNETNGAAVIEIMNGNTYVNGELVSSSADSKDTRRRIVVNVKDDNKVQEKREPIDGDDYADHSRRTVLGVLTDQYGDYDGAHVSSVVRNSPADEAGLMPGDLILKVNGREIRDSWDLTNAINDHDGGEKVMITYDRRGRILHAEAMLAETTTMRRHQTYEYTVPDLHGKRRVPGPFLNAYTYNTVDNYFDYTPQMGVTAQGAANGRGVSVLDVKSGSPADYAGLRNGDVILRMDHVRVMTVADIQDILDDTWPNQKIAVEFKRDGMLMYTYIRFTKEKTKKEL